MPRMKVKASARIISAADMRKRIEKGNYKALQYAGRDVWQAVKRGIGQSAPSQTKAGAKAVKAGAVVEMMDGLYRDLTMLGSGKPRAAGKPIKSWSPKRFYYSSVLTFWDAGRKSVVIGPYKGGDIARLHQFGGTVTLRAYRIGKRAASDALRAKNAGLPIRQRANKQYDYGAILWSQKGFRGMKNWEPTSVTKRARYPARPFMRGAAQVERVIGRIRERFRNTLPIGGRAA
jgi:phage gpG-like protein